MSNTQVVSSFHFRSTNNDTGSLHVGGNLPIRLQVNGMRLPKGQLFLKVGAEAPRDITYIMGSAKKGWSVCCKGSAPFKTGDLDAQVEISELTVEQATTQE